MAAARPSQAEQFVHYSSNGLMRDGVDKNEGCVKDEVLLSDVVTPVFDQSVSFWQSRMMLDVSRFQAG